MVNWQENGVPFENFNEKLTQEWIKQGFEYDECREWINIGLTPYEAKLATWLRDIKSQDIENFAEPQWVKFNADLEQLREAFANQEEENEEKLKSSEEECEEKINAQEWLDGKYPQEERENTKELHINTNLEGELVLSEFTNLEKIYISYLVDENDLEIKDKAKYEGKLVKLVNAQGWLESQEEYNTKQKREKVEKLSIKNRNLEGHLDLKDFADLKELDCYNNQLTSLNLEGLDQLEKLNCPNNYLTNFDYSVLNPEKLTYLNITGNNLHADTPQDISCFSNFTNLETLWIGSDDEEIRSGNYNGFVGSLERLKNLTKLKSLYISNTDIDSGLGCLPESVEKIYCSSQERSESKVNKISKQLVFCDNNVSIWKEWDKRGFNSEEIKQLKEAGLKTNDWNFAAYLKNHHDDISEFKAESLENLRQEDFNNWIKVAQNYLDNYSAEAKEKITNLDISNKNLEGSLDLAGFSSLKKLNLANNQITELKLEDYTNLESLDCSNNLLARTDFLNKLSSDKLIYLNIKNNNFEEQDLLFLQPFTNLEELYLGTDNKDKIKEGKYNRFAGSLEHLKDLTNLKIIDINNTDINNDGLESLLKNSKDVKEIRCSTKERPDSKVKEIAEQLSKDDSFIASGENKYLKRITAKQWLNDNYPNKKEVEKIDLVSLYKSINAEGELVINDFAKLKEITSSRWYWVDKVNKVVIKDCPQLEKVKISYFQNNKEINVNNCLNLIEFDCHYNNLEKLNIDCLSLENLTCSNNKLTKLNLNKLSNLKKLKCSDNPNIKLVINKQNSSLEEVIADKKLSEENEFLKSSFIFYNNKCLKKQYSQEWLDKNFPKNESSKLVGYEEKTRSEITNLNISEKGLAGELNLDGFTDLKELNCQNNQLTKLDLNNCSYLEKLNCFNNEITDLNLDKCSDLKELHCYSNKLKILNTGNFNKLENLSCNDNLIEEFNFASLNTEKLTGLNIKNNDLSEKNISVFSNFTKLKQLSIGNDDKEKIGEKKFNHFVGSLSFLEKLTDLENLHISNTDISEGDIKDLPEKLSTSKFDCSTEERPESKVKNIQGNLYSYLTKKRLNEIYPDKSVTVLNNLYSKGLKGHLDLSEYEDLEELRCSNNQLTNINISKNTKLRKLNCSNNELKEINLKNNTDLKELNCSQNKLTELKGVEHCHKLSSLIYHGNDKLPKSLENLTKLNKLKGQWKSKVAQQWLDDEYPKGGKCLGKFDKENEGKKRDQIEELNINSEGLTGELRLNNFGKLKHLSCYNNQLTGIYLSDCLELESVDCRNNELEKLEFCKDCKLKELKASGNKFTSTEKIFGESPTAPSLNHLNISNNNISKDDISYFVSFKNLENLDISNNGFKGYLENLNGLDELAEINIHGTDVKFFSSSNSVKQDGESKLKEVKDGLEVTKHKDEESKLREDKSLPKKLRKIYSKSFPEKLEEKYSYDEKGEFYNLSNSVNKEKDGISENNEIKSIVKAPILLGNRGRYDVYRIIEDCNDKKEVDYYNGGKLIYPSEEAGFSWETGEELRVNDLPPRLCYISDEVFELFSIKKYFEKNNIESVSLKDESLLIDYKNKNKESETVTTENVARELQEIKDYLQKEPKESNKSLNKHQLDNKKIEIKRKIECGSDAKKHYAILSYSWGGKPREDIKWSTGSVVERLSLGGRVSLEKAIQTLKVLNKFHGLNIKGNEIKYLWMDQLCTNQGDHGEVEEGFSNMGEYYGNSTVTLVPIQADIGRQTMKKLLNSFEKDKDGFIYPNAIVESSLPILEKIMGSEWFSRTWTFQEGLLSKRTIFMFDDFLIDGRFMSLIWKLRQFSGVYYDKCTSMEQLCKEKVATPVGWTYYEEGYSHEDKASLRLNEALLAVKRREKITSLDGIYSVIGLLPYGDKVKIDNNKDSESVLQEVMLIAAEEGYGELLAWHGSGSKMPGLCWVPEIDSSSRSNRMMGTININCKLKGKVEFEPDKGIKITGSEYVITEKNSDICNIDKEEIVEGGLWERKIQVKSENNEEIKLTLSGTKDAMRSLGKGRMLIVPNSKEWESDTHFAILSLKTKDDYIEMIEGLPKNSPLTLEQSKKLEELKELKNQDNTRHRIDIVRIKEGYENLIAKQIKDGEEVETPKSEEKTFIIGLDNQELQAQIETPPKK